MSLSATQIEQALAPLAAPLLESLWASTLLPALQAEAAKAAGALAPIEAAGITFVDTVVKAELAKLAAI